MKAGVLDPAFEANLADIAHGLRSAHACHTAILYGSFARGDATAQSDYDVAGFADRATVVRIAGTWRGSYLDVFVYPDTKLDAADAELLRLRGGVVLFERDGAGERLLASLEEIFAGGPRPLPADELRARRQWAWKMLDRAGRGDTEGNYRRAWLLTALLEDCFHLRERWYEGPKQSLAGLEREAPALHRAFEDALQPGASLETLARLVETVAGPRVDARTQEQLMARPG